MKTEANSEARLGFEYLFEIVGQDGRVRDAWAQHNLMPTEGLNHMGGVTLKGVSQVANWFVGVYSGNYTPVAGDTAATFPASATESSAYSEATRVALVLGSFAGGTADNSASRAEFTASGTVTLYGGFVSSASAKGSTSGTLLSAVRFASPKALTAGEILRVTAGFTFVSV